ncbi:MFS transporter [Terasakiella brassicae]|uniref:MFS transporter n=1 Tax=Terasakiella brassicae TaxID=1634917 RepID=A0A917C0P4_9PROT|nr:MFS transporter [Terasakiella brassicae]GGF64781.1 MFS transporter [Terasakiella brassicae]
MNRAISPFIALLASIWLINLGGGLQGTLLGLRAEMESFELTSTGFILSSYFLGYIVSFFVIPSFINSVGHIRSFAAFASLSSAATLLHAVFVDPYVWFCLRLLTGLCFGGLVLVGESWLNASTGNDNRGTVFSVYMLIVLSASAISQILLNLTSVSGYNLFVLVSVALSVALLPLTLGKKIVAPEIQESSTMAFGKLAKRFPLGILGIMVSGLVSGALWTMVAVYVLRIGLTTSDVSQVMFFLMVGGMISLWPIGKLSDRIDRRKIILGLGLGTSLACAFFLIPAFLNADTIKYMAALLGFMAFPLYAISSSHISDYLEQDEFVPACGSMVLFYGLGALISPLVSAQAMQIIGPNGLFMFMFVIQIPLIVLAAIRIFKKEALSSEEKTDFVFEMPKVTPSVSPLDPRNQEAEELADEAQREMEEREIADQEALEDDDTIRMTD